MQSGSKKNLDMGQYPTNLTPKEQNTSVGLIEKQKFLKLTMNDKPVYLRRLCK